MTSSIIDHLRTRLRAAGPARWESIAAEAGVERNLPRKIAYGDRTNPRVQTIQPLLDYFGEIDRGQRTLPAPAPDLRLATERMRNAA